MQQKIKVYHRFPCDLTEQVDQKENQEFKLKILLPKDINFN